MADAPRPYAELTSRAQVARMRPYVVAILEREYGFRDFDLRHIFHGENTTWRLTLPAPPRSWTRAAHWHPTRCLVRVHRATYNWPDEIRSELQWLQALQRDTVVPVPAPVMTHADRFTVPLSAPDLGGERLVSVTRWVAGRMYWKKPEVRTPERFERIGTVMAHLHDHVVAWRPPRGFTRAHWRDRGLATESGNADRGGENLWRLLTPEGRKVLRQVRTKALQAMDRLGYDLDQYGLIHGDLHMKNVVFRGESACPIDFDDTFYGHWLMDLAIASAYYKGSEEHLLRGYRRVRTFPDDSLRYLDLFRASRSANVLLWLVARAQTNPFFAQVRQRWEPDVLKECAAIQ